MDVCFSLLDEAEHNRIWDRIQKELQFRPSVRPNVPFRLPEPWAIHSLAGGLTPRQGEAFEDAVRQALTACMGTDSWIYALDWQHSGFRYDPRRPRAGYSLWVEDPRDPDGGYKAGFPGFFPDGDYYFFLQQDLKWGYLGHPWRHELWLFGAPLIEALSPGLEALGIPSVRRDTDPGEDGP